MIKIINPKLLQKSKILYENNVGSSNTISLVDNPLNQKKLEIVAIVNDSFTITTIIRPINNKPFSINFFNVDSQSSFYLYSNSYNIVDNKLELYRYGHAYLLIDGQVKTFLENKIKIVKVIGYKDDGGG